MENSPIFLVFWKKSGTLCIVYSMLRTLILKQPRKQKEIGERYITICSMLPHKNGLH